MNETAGVSPEHVVKPESTTMCVNSKTCVMIYGILGNRWGVMLRGALIVIIADQALCNFMHNSTKNFGVRNQGHRGPLCPSPAGATPPLLAADDRRQRLMMTPAVNVNLARLTRSAMGKRDL